MIRIVYSARALNDVERLTLFVDDDQLAEQILEVIVGGVETLSRHPYVGRPVRGALRELVLSFGRTGYVVLYRLARDRIEVLALRHQREAGFRR